MTEARRLPKLDTTLLMEKAVNLDLIEERSVHDEIEPWADEDSFTSDLEVRIDHLKPTIKVK